MDTQHARETFDSFMKFVQNGRAHVIFAIMVFYGDLPRAKRAHFNDRIFSMRLDGACVGCFAPLL